MNADGMGWTLFQVIASVDEDAADEATHHHIPNAINEEFCPCPINWQSSSAVTK